MKKIKGVFSDLLFLGGLGSVVYGTYLMYEPLSFIIGGGILTLILVKANNGHNTK